MRAEILNSKFRFEEFCETERDTDGEILPIRGLPTGWEPKTLQTQHSSLTKTGKGKDFWLAGKGKQGREKRKKFRGGGNRKKYMVGIYWPDIISIICLFVFAANQVKSLDQPPQMS